MPFPEVVILYASVSADMSAKGKTDDLRNLFERRGVPYSLLDGAYDPNRELRGKLFSVSGKRAVYPQVFIRAGPDDFSFVGLYDEIAEMNEVKEHTGAFNTAFAAVMAAAAGSATPGDSGVRHVDAAALGFSSSSPTPTPPSAASASSSPPQPSLPPPAGAPVSPVSAAPAPAAPAIDLPSPTAPPSQGRPKRASAWQRHNDAAGDAYWWNPATQESSWVDPEAHLHTGNQADSGCGALAAALAEAVARGVVVPSPQSHWIPQVDSRKKKLYFYNRATGKSAWTLPPGA